MKTLAELSLIFISENAAKYRATFIAELPVPLLNVLVTYLSAYELDRLTDVFQNAGIQTEAVWRLHLSRRWNRSLQSSVFVFGREDDWLTEGPKQQYMQRHFHALLQSVFHQINDPRDDLQTCLYRLPHPGQSPPAAPQPAPDLAADLLRYAPHVRLLTLRGSQCEYVVGGGRLVAALQGCVRRLHLHWLTDAVYPHAAALLGRLMWPGRTTELVLFHFQLSRGLTLQLLRLCAGGRPDGRTGAQADGQTGAEAEGRTGGERWTDTGSDGRCDSQAVAAGHWTEEAGRQADTSGDSLGDESLDLYDAALLPAGRPDSRADTATTQLGDMYGPQEGSAKGLQGIGLITGSRFRDAIDVFGDVLPFWPHLHKVALIGASVTDERCYNILLAKLAAGQLSHLVMVECAFSDHRVITDVLQTLRQSTNRQSAIKRLLFSKVDMTVDLRWGTHRAPRVSDAVGRGPLPPAQGGTPFVGVVDLDLSQNHLSDGCVDHLVEEIRHDTALRQLTLDSCLLSRCQLRAVLCALTENKALEKLSLDHINMLDEELQLHKCLVDLLRKMLNLGSLSLRECNLSKAFVSSEEFINAIKLNPGLRELDLAGNRLGDAACHLLLSLVDKDSTSKLASLDIGYNCISSQSLLSAAETMRSESRARRGGHRLTRLTLSGNPMASQHARVKETFESTVDQLQADVFDDTSYLLDHASQM